MRWLSVKQICKKKKGFTLVEIIIALCIMVTLTAVLVPTFIHFLNDAKVQKDTVKFESMVNAFKTTMGDDEVRRWVEKTWPEFKNDDGEKHELELTFDIVGGHIDFKSGRLATPNYMIRFEQSKLGLNSYQSIGTEYQMEQTKVLNGQLIFHITPKTSKTTVTVTYELKLED